MIVIGYGCWQYYLGVHLLNRIVHIFQWKIHYDRGVSEVMADPHSKTMIVSIPKSMVIHDLDDSGHPHDLGNLHTSARVMLVKSINQSH